MDIAKKIAHLLCNVHRKDLATGQGARWPLIWALGELVTKNAVGSRGILDSRIIAEARRERKGSLESNPKSMLKSAELESKS
jgi:hypothetical protein